jgi:hypothetical protein
MLFFARRIFEANIGFIRLSFLKRQRFERVEQREQLLPR